MSGPERVRVDPGAVTFNRHVRDILIAGKVYEDPTVPGVIYTLDGETWKPAEDKIRFEYGTNNSSLVQTGCWTGDRFLMYVEPGDSSHSFLAQSTDGIHWDWLPDASGLTIPDLNGSEYNVFEMKAGGTGFVMMLSSDFNGAFVSTDFGATWALVDVDGFGMSFNHLAVNGRTAVVSGASLGDGYAYYTTDRGTTWTPISFPPSMQSRFLTWLEFVNGAWWFSMDNYLFGNPVDGLLWKTSDFVNWERVMVPWDADFPPAVAYAETEDPFANGYITRFKPDSTGLGVVAVGFSFPSPMPDGQILYTPDGGNTWKAVVTTDWGPNVEDTPIQNYTLAVLSEAESDLDVGDTQGIEFFFDRWWISNNESSLDISTPVMLSASADMTEWKYLRFSNPLIGDGWRHLTMPVAPIVGATV